MSNAKAAARPRIVVRDNTRKTAKHLFTLVGCFAFALICFGRPQLIPAGIETQNGVIFNTKIASVGELGDPALRCVFSFPYWRIKGEMRTVTFSIRSNIFDE